MTSEAASTEATRRAGPVRRTRAIRLILAWGFVGIPLLWGVLMTLANAVKLFE